MKKIAPPSEPVTLFEYPTSRGYIWSSPSTTIAFSFWPDRGEMNIVDSNGPALFAHPRSIKAARKLIKEDGYLIEAEPRHVDVHTVGLSEATQDS